MKRIVFMLSILVVAFSSEAQTNLDSIYSIWQNQSMPDTSRLQALHNYSKEYLNTKPDSAFYFAQMGFDFAKQRNMASYMIRALNIQANSFSTKRSFDSAIQYYEKSMAISVQTKDTKSEAQTLRSLGLMYQRISEYSTAIEYFRRALKINEASAYKFGIADNLNRIGDVYWRMSDLTTALNYWQQALRINEEIDNKDGIADDLNGIGIIHKRSANYVKALEYYHKSLEMYKTLENRRGEANLLFNIGIVHQQQGKLEEALSYFTQAKNIRLEFGEYEEASEEFSMLGEVYLAKEELHKALEHFQIAYKYAVNFKMKLIQAGTSISIGQVYIQLNNQTEAQHWCKSGLSMAIEISALEEQKAGCKCLYDSYRTQGNSDKALEYNELLNAIQDSLDSKETARELQQMEFEKEMFADSIAKVEEDRLLQEAHTEEVRKKDTTRNVAFGVGIVLFILAGGLYTRIRYIRKSKAVLQVEKDRSENLLLNILPEEIAQELKEKGKADARDFEMVSILFTDFKDFTEQSAKLSAAELVHEINHCFEAFDGIIEKYNVEKIKTIGDAYMAAGGLPVPADNSVKNTVLAALEMQAFISTRKAANDAEGKPAFEMRVGIHTGPVVAGIVGVKKFQYDIWGDTVNTASRIESNGQAGKVNISQATYELLKDDPDFAFESRGKIEAKGKGEIEMYFVKNRESLDDQAKS